MNDFREVWLYELDYPKNMEITYENARDNLKVKHISGNCTEEELDIFMQNHSHDINNDDFDGVVPSICSQSRDDTNVMKIFFDAMTSIYNNCEYYNFTNTSKFYEYKNVFENLYKAAYYNNNYIPFVEEIDLKIN